jgi:hypothetical protein
VPHFERVSRIATDVFIGYRRTNISWAIGLALSTFFYSIVGEKEAVVRVPANG